MAESSRKAEDQAIYTRFPILRDGKAKLLFTYGGLDPCGHSTNFRNNCRECRERYLEAVDRRIRRCFGLTQGESWTEEIPSAEEDLPAEFTMLVNRNQDSGEKDLTVWVKLYYKRYGSEIPKLLDFCANFDTQKSTNETTVFSSQECFPVDIGYFKQLQCGDRWAYYDRNPLMFLMMPDGKFASVFIHLANFAYELYSVGADQYRISFFLKCNTGIKNKISKPIIIDPNGKWACDTKHPVGQ